MRSSSSSQVKIIATMKKKIRLKEGSYLNYCTLNKPNIAIMFVVVVLKACWKRGSVLCSILLALKCDGGTLCQLSVDAPSVRTSHELTLPRLQLGPPLFERAAHCGARVKSRERTDGAGGAQGWDNKAKEKNNDKMDGGQKRREGG